MTETRSQTRSRAGLFAAVRRDQDTHVQLGAPGAHARARARLLQALDDVPASVPLPRPRRGLWIGGGLGLGFVAAVVCLCLLFFPSSSPSEKGGEVLAFSVDGVAQGGGVAQAGDFADPDLRAQRVEAGAYTRRLEFSDGTEVQLAAGGGLRVEGLRTNGATLTLERGEVELTVHHERDTSWQVVAGPWTVHVTGTVFHVKWEPSPPSFEVFVREGSVRVEGPRGEVARLGAGERLVRVLEAEGPARHAEHAGHPGRDQALAEFPEPSLVEAVVVPESGSAGEPEPAPRSAVRRSKAKSKSKSKAKPSAWASHYRANRFEEAWTALAEHPGGLRGEAERVDAMGLLDLADLARFNGHKDDAKEVLERGRERFPDTPQASEAAFMLGKMAADDQEWREAALWLERYLAERPEGTLAADALGLLMVSQASAGELGAAKSVALRYLVRDPDGAYAASAHKILAR